MSQHCFCLTNARCVFAEEIVQKDLYISEGKICTARSDAKIIDCKGAYVAPGLIDLQINGIADIDFTTNPAAILQAQKLLAKLGTTSFLATIISQPEYSEILSKIPTHPNLLGVHLEGPFLNKQFAGAHNSDYFANCHSLPYDVKMVTLAPELEGAFELIAELHKRGAIVSCGHSGASRPILEKAKSYGLSMVTHLFNTMSPFHHRSPGIIGFTLGAQALYYSLIVDGLHLAKDTVLMAYNAHPEGLILVSDMSADTLGGQKLDGHYLKGTNVLAGSRASLFDCMIRLYQYTNNLTFAVQCASTRPAQLLGVNKGKLEYGYDADLIVFTEKLEPIMTFVAGSLVC